jgi:hypothetical protein
VRHNEYDIGAAFQAIEDELIKSMIRNMDRHRAEETKEGIEWSMWQAEQLKALEKYKRDNRKRYGKQFQNLNKEIGELIRISRQKGNMQQEIQILNAIRKGFPARKISKGATAEFFKLNDRKLEALIEATTHDMEAAETAVLRKANDDYRKAIFNAQVYANTGAGTYEKAVDMATRDMLSRGLNCVEYANGARHTLADYADMAIRTASKRAYLQGEGEKRQEWGITTVIVNKRGNPCPKCLPFVGKVLIDDVWSGGKKSDGPYPLMSKAIVAGLYHPRCKDSHTTYFPGISTADDTWTKEELEAVGQANKQEAEQQYASRQVEKYGRLAKYSLDPENRKNYKIKAASWSNATQSGIIKERAFKNLVIDRLPRLEDIQDNTTRKKFAETLISCLGIDGDVKVSLKKISARGQCLFYVDGDTCNYFEYTLQSNDDRSKPYKIKTAFHEAFHLSLKGHKWDAVKNGKINEKWRIIEESLTEASAHYAMKLYGVEENLAPSYADLLIHTLPRMRRLDKFKGCSNLEDFGKIAWKDRLLGNSGKWEDLYDQVFSVKFDESKYYKQYFGYIEKHKDELFDKFFENAPGLTKYRPAMEQDLRNSMDAFRNGKSFSNLSRNEKTVFSDILVNAMQKEGIK